MCPELMAIAGQSMARHSSANEQHQQQQQNLIKSWPKKRRQNTRFVYNQNSNNNYKSLPARTTRCQSIPTTPSIKVPINQLVTVQLPLINSTRHHQHFESQLSANCERLVSPVSSDVGSSVSSATGCGASGSLRSLATTCGTDSGLGSADDACSLHSNESSSLGANSLVIETGGTYTRHRNRHVSASESEESELNRFDLALESSEEWPTITCNTVTVESSLTRITDTQLRRGSWTPMAKCDQISAKYLTSRLSIDVSQLNLEQTATTNEQQQQQENLEKSIDIQFNLEEQKMTAKQSKYQKHKPQLVAVPSKKNQKQKQKFKRSNQQQQQQQQDQNQDQLLPSIGIESDVIVPTATNIEHNDNNMSNSKKEDENLSIGETIINQSHDEIGITQRANFNSSRYSGRLINKSRLVVHRVPSDGQTMIASKADQSLNQLSHHQMNQIEANRKNLLGHSIQSMNDHYHRPVGTLNPMAMISPSMPLTSIGGLGNPMAHPLAVSPISRKWPTIQRRRRSSPAAYGCVANHASTMQQQLHVTPARFWRLHWESLANQMIDPMLDGRSLRSNFIMSHDGQKTMGSRVSNNREFSVMCYNILCAHYATDVMFPYCPRWALDWQHRRMSILNEILIHGADLVSLQELEWGQFHDYFQPQLAAAGYDGLFEPKSRAKTMHEPSRVDGCAIFFKRTRFELVAHQLVEFNQLAMANAQGSAVMLNRVMTRDNIGLVLVLELIEPQPPPEAHCAPVDATNGPQQYDENDDVFVDISSTNSTTPNNINCWREKQQQQQQHRQKGASLPNWSSGETSDWPPLGRTSATDEQANDDQQKNSNVHIEENHVVSNDDSESQTQMNENSKIHTKRHRIVVANTHLHWDPQQCDVKLVQAIMLMNELHKIAAVHSNLPNSLAPLVLCGDFNSTPTSSVVEFITRGRIGSQHCDFKRLDADYEQCLLQCQCLLQSAHQTAPVSTTCSINVTTANSSAAKCTTPIKCISSRLQPQPPLSSSSLSSPTTESSSAELQHHNQRFYRHPFEMGSSDYELPFTTYTPDFKDVIDYVFYSRDKMRLIASLGPIDRRWFSNNHIAGLPHPQVPSDHVPVLVKLELTETSSSSLAPQFHNNYINNNNNNGSARLHSANIIETQICSACK